MIMPCYNEESLIGYTIPRLVNAFRTAGYRLELIAVDNGSADQTGHIIQDLEMKNPEVVHHRVEVNEGYGNGVLSGDSNVHCALDRHHTCGWTGGC